MRESGWMMSTGAPCLVAHPLHAAVAFAQFGVPDGYVTPHDSPAAYARAVEASRDRVAAALRVGPVAPPGGDRRPG
jgi:hypothetical protein